jgi:hypothetical protein
VFGTQDKAFTEVDRKLDRDHFLQDRAASTGVFNATQTMASTKGRNKKKNFFDQDSDSEDEDAEYRIRNKVNSIQISLPVVDAVFDLYL